MCQHSEGSTFYYQWYEFADSRIVESGVQGMDDPRDIGSRNLGVGCGHPRDHLVDLHGFVRLRHPHIF
jgi:hypothetical protein